MKLVKKIIDNNIVRMVTALFVCGVLSAFLLVLVYQKTKPLILENQAEEMQRAIRDIFPRVNTLEELEDELFRVYSEGEELLGYAFTAVGTGYQGEIKLMIGAEPDLEKLKGIEVLKSQETPGLGAEIMSDDFQNQFEGLNVGRKVVYLQNRPAEESHEIEAITGATISSSAVVDIINSAVGRVYRKLEVDR